MSNPELIIKNMSSMNKTTMIGCRSDGDVVFAEEKVIQPNSSVSLQGIPVGQFEIAISINNSISNGQQFTNNGDLDQIIVEISDNQINFQPPVRGANNTPAVQQPSVEQQGQPTQQQKQQPVNNQPPQNQPQQPPQNQPQQPPQNQPQQPPQNQPQQPRQGQSQQKDPTTAALLSFLWPGLGQIINGEAGRGIGIMIGVFIGYFIGFLTLAIIVGIPILLVTAVFQIWQIIDAKNRAEKINRGEIVP